MSPKLTPKGMRDFPPEEMIVREAVRDSIIAVYRKYGFRPMATPAMEYLDTLRAKAGEEIDQQIFVLSDEKLALRFDLTVPLARVAANSDFPRPFKRYYVGPVWRKEEPQKGRFREFYQADVDIIGTKSMRADAELLTMANELCGDFGFSKPKIMVNNRKILDSLAKKVGFVKEKDDVFRILDKMDKIGEDAAEEGIRDLLGVRAEELLEYTANKRTNAEKLESVRKISSDGVKELEEILSLCDFPVEVDLSMVRGLGYYTGPVFEIKLSEDIGTVIAGGRYDNLLSIYGRGDYATGISVGIERLITLVMGKEKSGGKTYSSVFVACATQEFYKDALNLAAYLRENGINAETDLNERTLGKQFDFANSLSIPYTIIVGKRELSSGKFTLRNMKTGKEQSVSKEQIVKKLKS
jgi:histidyl-tRNA synthetase